MVQWLPAAIQATGQIAGDSISAIASSSNAKKAAKYAYRYALKQARNLPSAQKEGLLKAGYNPILAVNSGTDFGSAINVQPADASYFSHSGKALADAINSAYTNSAKKAETDIKKATVETAKLQPTLAKAQVDKIQHEIDNIDAQTDLTISSARNIDQQIGLNRERINFLQKRGLLTDAQANQLIYGTTEGGLNWFLRRTFKEPIRRFDPKDPLWYKPRPKTFEEKLREEEKAKEKKYKAELFHKRLNQFPPFFIGM